jgi:hypothetical protein
MLFHPQKTLQKAFNFFTRHGCPLGNHPIVQKPDWFPGKLEIARRRTRAARKSTQKNLNQSTPILSDNPNPARSASSNR